MKGMMSVDQDSFQTNIHQCLIQDLRSLVTLITKQSRQFRGQRALVLPRSRRGQWVLLLRREIISHFCYLDLSLQRRARSINWTLINLGWTRRHGRLSPLKLTRKKKRKENCTQGMIKSRYWTSRKKWTTRRNKNKEEGFTRSYPRLRKNWPCMKWKKCTSTHVI